MKKILFLFILLHLTPALAAKNACSALEGSWETNNKDEKNISLSFKGDTFDYTIHGTKKGDAHHSGQWRCEERSVYLTSDVEVENKKKGYFSVINVPAYADKHLVIRVVHGPLKKKEFMLIRSEEKGLANN